MKNTVKHCIPLLGIYKLTPNYLRWGLLSSLTNQYTAFQVIVNPFFCPLGNPMAKASDHNYLRAITL